MRLRVPTPLKGWRAFLDEILIVVLGVFIALAAQQWVEDRSWRQRTSDARQAISEEVAAHYVNALEWRIAEPCIAAQLSRLEARLRAGGSALAPAPIYEANGRRFVVRAPNRPYVDTSWQAAVAEGVSSHFSTDERLDLGAHFANAEKMKEHNDEFRHAVTRLNSMARPMAIDPSVRLALLQALDEARDLNSWLGLMSGQLVGAVKELNMVPPGSQVRQETADSPTAIFCREQNLPLLPLSDALKSLS